MANPDASSRAALAARRRSNAWRRIWAVALVTFRRGMRMRLWILAPIAMVILIATDLSSPRFDLVFEGVPAAVGTSLLVMTVLAVVLGVFFATYPIPAEMETKVCYSMVTKPLGRWEIVAGTTAGMSVLVLAMLAAVGVAAYGYILFRAGGIQSLAASRLEEARRHVVHPADLNALEAAARDGPLSTFRYRAVDAGPDVAIRFPPDMPPEPGVHWILGETSMLLRWNLAETPLREWLASGTGRVRVRLKVRPPSEAAPAPLKVNVALTSEKLADSARPEAPQGHSPQVKQVVVAVGPSGMIEVPVAGPKAQPVKGVLNVPPSGDVALEVGAATPGYLVGGVAGAVRIVGPGGQTFAVKAGPEAQREAHRGRAYLVGRNNLPRQVAAFRFDDVPGEALGPGDTTVEIGLSVDAWSPASIQPAAEIVFRNPATGQQIPFTFTPESHHATLLHLDRAFWHGGPLEARLESVTDNDYLGVVPGSVRLRLAGGPFAVHFAKAVLCVWLFGTVLAALGVLPSTRFTWYTSILGTGTLLLASFMRAFLRNYLLRETSVGARVWRVAEWARSVWDWSGWNTVAQQAVVPVPDVWALLPDDSATLGQVIPLADLAASFGWAALATAVLVLLAAMLLRNREVAA